jgi:hypothetical protein
MSRRYIGCGFAHIVVVRRLQSGVVRIVMLLGLCLFVCCRIGLTMIVLFIWILLLIVVFDLLFFLDLFPRLFLLMVIRSFDLFLALRHLLFGLVSLLLLLIVGPLLIVLVDFLIALHLLFRLLFEALFDLVTRFLPQMMNNLHLSCIHHRHHFWLSFELQIKFILTCFCLDLVFCIPKML